MLELEGSAALMALEQVGAELVLSQEGLGQEGSMELEWEDELAERGWFEAVPDLAGEMQEDSKQVAEQGAPEPAARCLAPVPEGRFTEASQAITEQTLYSYYNYKHEPQIR